mgnify:FL=1
MRIIVSLLLLFSTAPAWAEWTQIGKTTDGVVYVDEATTRKISGHLSIWSLVDLKARGPDGEMSRRYLEEYDCKERRSKVLSKSTHAAPMAEGKVLSSYERKSAWMYVPPNTASEYALKFLCTPK